MSTPTINPSLVDRCRFQEDRHYDPDNIEQIAGDLRSNGGLILNPIHLIRKGDRWECIAGHDRLEAARRTAIEFMPYRDFTGTVVSDEDVYSHWRRDNTLRKTPDKRDAATETLIRYPVWSNRKIADVCGCSDPFVGTLRAELVEAGLVQTVSTVTGKDGVEQPASKRHGNGVPKGEPKKSKPASNEDWSREQRKRDADARADLLESEPETPDEPDDMSHCQDCGRSWMADVPGDLCPYCHKSPEARIADLDAARATEPDTAENVRSHHTRARPVDSRVRALVSAAQDMGGLDDEQVDALQTNDLMIEGLRRAVVQIERIIEAHHSKRKQA